jgi:hypothetical protein
MLVLLGVVAVAIIFAWYTLRDLNTPLNDTLTAQNVPLKKADEINGAPPPMEVSVVAEVAKQKPAVKIRAAKTTTTKTKKTPGRKKKTT